MFGWRERPDSKAFHELLDVLRAYEKKFLRRRFLRGDTELAEGYRAMLDLLATGLDCYVHNSPERPRFVSLVSPVRKIGGDNADALYYFAPIAPGRGYRIRGTMGGAVYLGFTIYGGEDAKKFHIVSNASTPEVQIAPDGSFELRITPRSSGARNDLRTDGSASCIVLRRYYLDDAEMAQRPGQQSIEPDDAPSTPGLLTGVEMERQLRLLTSFLEGWFRFIPMPMPPIPFAYNRLVPPRQASSDTGHWSTPDNMHSFGFYLLKENQALYIRGRSPECLYWSVHLWSPYLQTYDYVNHPCAMNSEAVKLSPDGSFELCIAHRDPGHDNWISTTGRPRGFVYFRWLKAKGVPAKLETRVRTV